MGRVGCRVVVRGKLGADVWKYGRVCGRECGWKGGCVGEWVVKVGREGDRVGGLSGLC